jgi:NADH-quinone oxidoreductase subunit K
VFVYIFLALLLYISFWGVLTTRSTLITLLLAIELFLLSISLTFITTSLYLDDIVGELFSLSILIIAGAESAIGLVILVKIFRLSGSLVLTELNHLKG